MVPFIFFYVKTTFTRIHCTFKFTVVELRVFIQPLDLRIFDAY